MIGQSQLSVNDSSQIVPDTSGISIAVVVVPESDIEEFRGDEVLAVRPLAEMPAE